MKAKSLWKYLRTPSPEYCFRHASLWHLEVFLDILRNSKTATKAHLYGALDSLHRLCLQGKKQVSVIATPSHNTIALILKAMKKHVNDAKVQQLGASILSRLSLRRKMVTEKDMETLICVLHIHVNDASIVKPICEIFAQLGFEKSDRLNLTDIIKLGLKALNLYLDTDESMVTVILKQLFVCLLTSVDVGYLNKDLVQGHLIQGHSNGTEYLRTILKAYKRYPRNFDIAQLSVDILQLRIIFHDSMCLAQLVEDGLIETMFFSMEADTITRGMHRSLVMLLAYVSQPLDHHKTDTRVSYFVWAEYDSAFEKLKQRVRVKIVELGGVEHFVTKLHETNGPLNLKMRIRCHITIMECLRTLICAPETSSVASYRFQKSMINVNFIPLGRWLSFHKESVNYCIAVCQIIARLVIVNGDVYLGSELDTGECAVDLDRALATHLHTRRNAFHSLVICTTLVKVVSGNAATEEYWLKRSKERTSIEKLRRCQRMLLRDLSLRGVIHGMEIFPEDEVIQEEGCHCVNSLIPSKGEIWRRGDACNQRVVRAILTAMRSNQESLEVNTVGTRVIFLYARSLQHSRMILFPWPSDTLSVIEAAVSKFGDDSTEIQEKGNLTLETLRNIQFTDEFVNGIVFTE